jgi:hypothetical protein
MVLVAITQRPTAHLATTIESNLPTNKESFLCFVMLTTFSFRFPAGCLPNKLCQTASCLAGINLQDQGMIGNERRMKIS